MAVSKASRSKKKRGGKKGGRSKRKTVDDTSYFGSGISNGAIRRLARKGGIKRISSDVYDKTREIYIRFLDKLTHDAYSYTECAKRKTILPIDVVYALKRQGRNIYGYVHDHEVGGHHGVTHEDDK